MKIEVDYSEFNQAMQAYLEASQKDAPTVVNHAAKNLAFRSVQFCKRADKSSIETLPSNSWWWKYISKRAGKGATKKQRAALSKKILAARKKSVGFIASGFLAAAKAFQAAEGKSPRSNGAKIFGRNKGDGFPAFYGQDEPSAIVVNTAGGTKSATAPQALLAYGGDALTRAMRFVTDDLMKYAMRKMEKTANQYSAK